MNHLRTRMWFRPGTGEKFLISPYLGFSGCCQGNCQLSWHWWVSHLANVLQWFFNEAQGRLEVKSATISGLIGFNQFLFLSFATASWNLSSVQSVSCVWLFVTPWTTACQASLLITNSWSLLKFVSIGLGMPSNHLIFCHPLLLPPSIFPSIRVFSNESVLCKELELQL